MSKHARSLYALAAALLALPAATAQAYDWRFCLRTQVTTTDSGVGEDYYDTAGDTSHPARHARVRVTRNGATLWPTGYADANGCVDFESPYTDDFHVELWSEARIPRTDNSNYTNLLSVEFADGTQAYWHWYASYGAGGGTKTLYTNLTRRSTLLGLSSWIVKRWSDGLVNKTYTVRDAACPSIPDNSCLSGGIVYINPTHYDRKFLVAHELGHALVHHWVNYSPSSDYGQNTGGANCTTPAGMHHALHSKEYQSAALTEGFAQFYATAAWNFETETAAWFRYYKDDYKNGSVTVVNVENGDTGGATAYLETQCTGTSDGRGVELDWMRALWDYRTNAGDAPSHYEILRQLKNGVIGGLWGDTTAYDAFTAGVLEYDQQHGTDFHARWLEMATFNGVDH